MLSQTELPSRPREAIPALFVVVELACAVTKIVAGPGAEVVTTCELDLELEVELALEVSVPIDGVAGSLFTTTTDFVVLAPVVSVAAVFARTFPIFVQNP